MGGWQRRRLLAALAGLAAAACTVPGPAGEIPPPEVQLTDLGLGTPGILTQELEVELRLTNFAEFDLPARGLRLTLWLAGERFGRGVSDASFTIPALGEARLRVPLHVSTADLLERVADLAIDGRLDYRLDGELLLESWFGSRRTLAFEGAGRMRLPRLPFGS